ncbi:hypothetical protein NDA07_12730 [Microcoleus vaginatus DQ-U2]|nr:hypothetical protein [Microcoleus sp. FACHB-DQ6]
MPVPQKFNVLVEQASCLFLRMVQDMSSNQFAPRLLRQTVWKKGRSHPANRSRLTKVRQSPRSPRFSTRYNKCNHT